MWITEQKHAGITPCFSCSWMWGWEIFFSSCIANALLDQDISVLMINFPSIPNRLDGMFSGDRADFIVSQGMYDLLPLDALGARIPSTQ